MSNRDLILDSNDADLLMQELYISILRKIENELLSCGFQLKIYGAFGYLQLLEECVLYCL